MLNHLVIKKTDTFLKEELIDSKTVNWIIDDADVSEFEDRLLKCGFTHPPSPFETPPSVAKLGITECKMIMGSKTHTRFQGRPLGSIG